MRGRGGKGVNKVEREKRLGRREELPRGRGEWKKRKDSKSLFCGN